jgi:Ca-activated chloride channel family protein
MAKDRAHSAKRKASMIIFLFMPYALCTMPCLFPAHCYAASPQQNLNVANKLYRQGKLDKALERYNEANLSLPDSDIINFNMGAALYKKEDYQKSIEAFTKALTSEDKKLEADALYNLGNCKYKLGKLKENTDLSATVGLLRESLDYYKRAVELEQKNTDARFNHEFVERELKVLLDKLKQQQSSADKQKEQEQQQSAKGEGQRAEGEEAGGESKVQRAKGIEQRHEGQKEEKEGQQGQLQEEEKQRFDSAQHPSPNYPEPVEGQKEQAAAEESQQEGQGKELSEEGARALLERYGQEQGVPDYQGRRPTAQEKEVLKDW